MNDIFNRVFRKSAFLTDQIFDRIPLAQILDEKSYRAGLDKYSLQIPKLSQADLEIVQTLEQEGIVITSLEDLNIPESQELVEAAQSLMPKILSTTAPKNGYYIHASSAQIMENQAIFLWGLNERLLKMAENYIRLPVSYQGSFFSRNLANGQEIGSRFWHKDLEDHRSFKLIVYLHDVFEDGGPFQYVPRNLTAKISHILKQKYGYGKHKRFTGQIMQQIVPVSEWKSCLGPAGTVIITDTSNVFHRGAIPEAADRVAIFFEYLSRRPKRPHYCKKLLSRQELNKVIKGLTSYQIECSMASQFRQITRLSPQNK